MRKSPLGYWSKQDSGQGGGGGGGGGLPDTLRSVWIEPTETVTLCKGSAQYYAISPPYFVRTDPYIPADVSNIAFWWEITNKQYSGEPNFSQKIAQQGTRSTRISVENMYRDVRMWAWFKCIVTYNGVDYESPIVVAEFRSW